VLVGFLDLVGRQAGDLMELDIKDILGESGLSKWVDIEFSAYDVGLSADGCEFCSPIHLKAEISNINGIIRIEGNISLEYDTFCARCLKPVKCKLSADVSEEFVKTDFAGAFNDADLYTYEGSLILLDGVVGTAILLQIPIRHLCRKDCKSLCPVCGKDLNDGDCGCEAKVLAGPFEALAELFRE